MFLLHVNFSKNKIVKTKNSGKGRMHGKSGDTVNRGPVNRGITVPQDSDFGVTQEEAMFSGLRKNASSRSQ